jgi:hypothetical protein
MVDFYCPRSFRDNFDLHSSFHLCSLSLGGVKGPRIAMQYSQIHSVDLIQKFWSVELLMNNVTVTWSSWNFHWWLVQIVISKWSRGSSDDSKGINIGIFWKRLSKSTQSIDVNICSQLAMKLSCLCPLSMGTASSLRLRANICLLYQESPASLKIGPRTNDQRLVHHPVCAVWTWTYMILTKNNNVEQYVTFIVHTGAKISSAMDRGSIFL